MAPRRLPWAAAIASVGRAAALPVLPRVARATFRGPTFRACRSTARRLSDTHRRAPCALVEPNVVRTVGSALTCRASCGSTPLAQGVSGRDGSAVLPCKASLPIRRAEHSARHGKRSGGGGRNRPTRAGADAGCENIMSRAFGCGPPVPTMPNQPFRQRPYVRPRGSLALAMRVGQDSPRPPPSCRQQRSRCGWHGRHAR